MVTIIEMVKKDKESSKELIKKCNEDLEHIKNEFVNEMLKLVNK